MDNTYELDGSITSERATFIMKVYGLLTLSVLSSVVGGIAGATFFTVQSPMVGMMSLIGFLALIAALFLRKVPGVNLALLFGFTFIEGLGMGPYLFALSTHGYAAEVSSAALTTMGAFGALTAYVFWSKTDFSYLRGFLFAGLIGLILVGLVAIFIPIGHAAHMFYLYAGVLIFIGYVLYDTSNIIRNVPTDEYVHGALELYLDLLNLFWFILRIFLSRRD